MAVMLCDKHSEIRLTSITVYFHYVPFPPPPPNLSPLIFGLSTTLQFPLRYSICLINGAVGSLWPAWDIVPHHYHRGRSEKWVFWAALRYCHSQYHHTGRPKQWVFCDSPRCCCSPLPYRKAVFWASWKYTITHHHHSGRPEWWVFWASPSYCCSPLSYSLRYSHHHHHRGRD